MKSVRAVVFDFDGTLYDKRGMALKVVLKNIGRLSMLKATRKTCTSFRGKDFGEEERLFSELFESIARKASVTAEEARDWYYENYLGAMTSILQKRYRVRPKAGEIISELRKKGIAVILYSDYGMCRERVEAIGLNASDFDGLYSSSEFGGLKPCEKPFLKMLSENGLSAQEVLLVGDSDECDRECAKRSGARFFSVKTNGDMERLYEKVTRGVI